MMSNVSPFAITEGDVASEPVENQPEAKKVRPIQKKSRIHALNEDAVWAIEIDLHRFRQTLETRQGPLTDKEHARLMKTVEQLRKLRVTDADIEKQHSTSEMDEFELDDEFEERCKARGLDSKLVLEAFGLA